ncbi:MAG: TonB-dependent receptor [Terriglobia bacterium]
MRAAGPFQLEGKIQDPTGNPIAGASIQFHSGSYSTSSLTDRQGRFIFKRLPTDSGTVTVRAAGFTVLQRAWSSGGKTSSTVLITLSLAHLAQQVTVTAARTKELVSKTAGSVVVLSRERLNSAAALTLDGKLSEIPGFSLYRRFDSSVANPTTQGVSLLGLGASGASRSLVLEDGFPLNDPFGAWVYWDRVPTEAVERIEVAEGGASDLYGSDALGGVVNIITRTANHSEFSLDTSYGNENTPDASFWGTLVRGRWGVDLGAEGFNTDGYILVPQDIRGKVDTAAGSNHTNLTLTLHRQFSNHSRAFVRGTVLGEARKNGTPVQTNRTHLREVAAGTDWQSALLGEISVRGYGEAQTFDQNFSAIAPSRNSESLVDLQRVPAQEAGFSVQWTRTLGSWQTWVAGVEGQSVRGASNDLIYFSGKANKATGAGGRQNIDGLFGEDIIRAGSKWVFTVSARLDDWRNDRALSTTRPLVTPGPIQVTYFPARSSTAFSPRVSVLRQLTPSLSVYASANRAFRAPTLNELYRPFRVGNVETLANSNLGAEHLTGAETGMTWIPRGRRLRVHASFFWSRINQPIANVTIASTPSLITDQRQNLGSTLSQGIEVEAESEITPSLMLSGGYQFADAKILSFPTDAALVGLFVPQIPRNALTFEARYTKPSLLTLALQGRYLGVQYDDVLNQYPLSPAFTLDVLASHPIGNRAEVYAAFENITDDRYQAARVPYTQVGPPVLARIGFRFNWGSSK